MQEGIRAAIAYIEAHLTESLDVHDVAAQAYVSAFHFQRMFTALCGMPLGEYIRHRRLTEAAQDLLQGAKVIDTAMKYGYDSPDSFSRAFRRFHGLLPSQAGKPGVTLRTLAPMGISLIQEETSMREVRIERKETFTVFGYKRQFSSETSYQEIPKWWTEQMAKDSKVMGMFGVCADCDGQLFDYMIADLYQPWQDVPEGCETYTVPGGLWAVFPCTLGTLQDTNTYMWKDWLPNNREYRLGGSCDLEFYYEMNQQDPPASRVELWLPVVPV